MSKLSIYVILGAFVAGVFFLCGASYAESADAVIEEGSARFTVIAAECIRIEYSRDGKFTDRPSYFAVNRDEGFREFKIVRKDKTLSIDTGKMILTYIPDGKPFHEGNLMAEIKKGGETAVWKPGMENAGNLGGTIRTVDGVYGPVDLGHGVLSRDGWYLLDDSRGVLLTDDWVMSRPRDAGTDWYLFGYGYDYKAALKAMTKAGGIIPMPRKYSLGVWYSRYWPYTAKDYREIVKEYHTHDFPLDIMVMDMDWHKDGWTGWSWNRKLLPDAERLLEWFHKKGLHVTLNVHPADGVGPHEDMYEDFMKAMGEDPAGKKTLLYDAGDKKYLDTLFKYTHEPHEKEGVDFWWLDWQQYQFTRSIPDLTNLAWLNEYYTRHTARGGLRGQSFSRWAGFGDHRHPIHFSGDSNSGWPMLAFEVPFTSTAGNVGCFFWSHDIGGHMGMRIPESYTRWVQFGATTAALRSHSTRSVELDRRPWKYQKWAEDSMRISFHLRSEIFPYIYSSARESTRDTVPLNRPMYVEYPENEKSYRNPQQYFFGAHLLVAPVVSPGAGKKKTGLQTVWFPESDWYNWFTGEKYEAGSESLVAADIYEFPLYARAGIPIPMQPYTERMATEPLDELVIRCYPGEEGKHGSFTLYEDDGVSTGYEKGEFAETDLTCGREGNSISVTVAPAVGSYKGQLEKRGYVLNIPATRKASVATVDGKALKPEYDKETFTNTIRVPERSIREKVTIAVTAELEDQSVIRNKAALARIAGLLDKSMSGGTVREAISRYTAGKTEADVLKALLGTAGLGMMGRNEAVYLYKGREKTYFFAAPGILDGDSFDLTVEERQGEIVKVLSKSTEKVAAARMYSASDLPQMEKGGESLGVPKKRLIKATFGIGGTPLELSGVLDQDVTYITKWNILGPFDFIRDNNISLQNFGPEEELDFSRTYKGLGGQGIKWKKASTGDDGIMDLTRYFFFDFRLAYAAALIYSKEDQEATLSINSDDGFELWMNGEKLKSVDRTNGFINERYEVKATLKKGKNVLLLKVSQYWGDWMYRVSIETNKPVSQSGK